MADDLKVKLVVSAKDEASGPLRKISAAIGGITSPLATVGKAAGITIGGLAALGAGIGALVKTQIIDTAAAFEVLETRLVTTEGSAEKARAALDWVSKFAAETPYELNEVTNAFIQLRARGLDASSGLLRSFGDMASSMAVPLEQAVGAVASAIRGESEPLRFFAINARREKDRMVLEWEQGGRKMQRSVANTAQAVASAVAEISDQKNMGSMKRLSLTWEGMWSNLSDQWTRFKLMIGRAGVFDQLKGWLAGVLEKIDEMANNGELQRIATLIGEGLTSAAKALISVLPDLAVSIRAIGDALAGIASVASGAIDAIRQVGNAWSEVAPYLRAAQAFSPANMARIALNRMDFSGEPAAATSSGPTRRGGAKVTVEFRNPPAGLRVGAKSAPGMELGVVVGAQGALQ